MERASVPFYSGRRLSHPGGAGWIGERRRVGRRRVGIRLWVVEGACDSEVGCTRCSSWMELMAQATLIAQAKLMMKAEDAHSKEVSSQKTHSEGGRLVTKVKGSGSLQGRHNGTAELATKVETEKLMTKVKGARRAHDGGKRLSWN